MPPRRRSSRRPSRGARGRPRRPRPGSRRRPAVVERVDRPLAGALPQGEVEAVIGTDERIGPGRELASPPTTAVRAVEREQPRLPGVVLGEDRHEVPPDDRGLGGPEPLGGPPSLARRGVEGVDVPVQRALGTPVEQVQEVHPSARHHRTSVPGAGVAVRRRRRLGLPGRRRRLGEPLWGDDVPVPRGATPADRPRVRSWRWITPRLARTVGRAVGFGLRLRVGRPAAGDCRGSGGAEQREEGTPRSGRHTSGFRGGGKCVFVGKWSSEPPRTRRRRAHGPASSARNRPAGDGVRHRRRTRAGGRGDGPRLRRGGSRPFRGVGARSPVARTRSWTVPRWRRAESVSYGLL